MNFIYENILKPILQILERFFIPKNKKEFVIIIDILDAIYEKGGNFITNIFFIVVFPILFFPLINFFIFIVGGVILTIFDMIISIFPIIEKGYFLELVKKVYLIECFFVICNLILFGHYVFTGMLKVRYDQTLRFFKTPFISVYDIKEYDLAYRKFRKNIK